MGNNGRGGCYKRSRHESGDKKDEDGEGSKESGKVKKTFGKKKAAFTRFKKYDGMSMWNEEVFAVKSEAGERWVESRDDVNEQYIVEYVMGIAGINTADEPTLTRERWEDLVDSTANRAYQIRKGNKRNTYRGQW